ncbi:MULTISPECIES: histidine phosphatase family protein [unclassified Lysinibacillus]|uniref:histidine phosphatase family protein n=1 Tax=unclassified Lysinibacillus TaxID=2636778 RepID=UPI00201B4429|nr:MULTISPECIES: histidine phosphatase family protein [unclassified Lysinibacillus]WCH49583.1 histidine phosphatase family protein [Lysinibacillus sp. OF-1]
MGDIVTVCLMRHAPTKENLEKRYLGWTDAPLAATTELAVVDANVDKVYGSDLLRCRETAAHYFPNASYQTEPRFRETNFGAFEGQTYEELKMNAHYCAWLDDPIHTPPPQGEAFDDFVTRVIDGFNHLPKDEDHYYLVVHGGVIRALLVAFAPTEQPFWSYQVPHDKQFVLTFSRKAWEEGARCMSLSEAPITAKPTM